MKNNNKTFTIVFALSMVAVIIIGLVDNPMFTGFTVTITCIICYLIGLNVNQYTQEELDQRLDEQAVRTTAQMLEKQKDLYSKTQVEEIIRLVYTDGYERGNAKLHWSGEIDKAVKFYLK